MAAEWDETCLDLSVSDFDADLVVRLQAAWRGWYVRKQMRDARMEFLEIVQELDGPAVTVEWAQSALPRPKVSKISRKTRTGKTENLKNAREQLQQAEESKPKTSEVSTKPECPNCAEKKPLTTESDTIVGKSSVASCTINVDRNKLDLEAQTEIDQQIEETNTEKRDSDCMVSVKKVVCQTESRSNDSSNQLNEKNSTAVRFGSIPPSDEEETCEKVAAKNERNIPTPLVPCIVGSSEGFQSLTGLPSAAEGKGCEGVVGVSESSGLRRVDSFHGDQTSVWDSSTSGLLQDTEAGVSRQPQEQSVSISRGGQPTVPVNLPQSSRGLRERSTEELVKQRQNAAMELLWVQQAIISRKKYLKLKQQMEATA